MADLNLFGLATRLVDCICPELRKPRAGSDEPGWEGSCCVWPGGQVAFDSCCEDGGQAWVLVKSAVPTTTFPFADTTGSPRCDTGMALAVTLEVGVLRCVCWDQCDCDVKEDNALKVFGDLQALLRGIQCCLGSDDDCGTDWRMLGFSMIGPEGGCAGSIINIVVEQPMPCCP